MCFVLIILINPFIILNKCNLRNVLLKPSEITLKIQGEDKEDKIISSTFYENYKNIDVYINNTLKEESNYEYYFPNGISIVKIIFNIEITSANRMFSECNNIIEIDLSKFDAPLIIDMSFMFNWCLALISLDLSNLNTSQVTNMKSMFTRCQSLESLDLSMLNTSKVKDMSYMFSQCMNLIYLNLSNFDTSKVSNMNSMFFKCSSLSSLDLSYFNTSETYDMIYMFGSCELLNSLDLSNFDMTKVTSISCMFHSCSELEYVNFKIAKFNSLLIDNLENVFTDTKNNLIVSLENENDF